MTKRDYDLIAACIGAALADNHDSKSKQFAIHDVARRLKLKLSYEHREFDNDTFDAHVQYWFEQHGGKS